MTSNNRLKKQPSQLYVLGTVVACERFSFYGMKMLLLYYLTEAHNMSDGNAKSISAAFTSLFFVVQFASGFITDRWLGNRLAVFIGSFFMMAGHMIMSINNFECFSYGLGVLVSSSIFMKVPIVALLGQSYEKGDPRRLIGFTLFYSIYNIGAIGALLLCELIARKYGWHYGFGLAAIVMMIGFVVYVLYRKLFFNTGAPKKQFKKRQLFTIFVVTIVVSKLFSFLILNHKVYNIVSIIITIAAVSTFLYIMFALKRSERKAMMKIGFISILCFFGFVVLTQFDYSVPLFIRRNVDRMISFSFMGNNFSYKLEANMLQMVNPLVLLFAGPLVSWVWNNLRKRGIALLETTKAMTGIIITTLAYTLFYFSTFTADETARIHYSYILIIMTVMSFSEVFFVPIGYSVISNEGAAKYKTLLLGLFTVMLGLSDQVAGKIAKLTDVDGDDRLNAFSSLEIYQSGFYDISLIFIGALLLLLLIGGFLNKKLKAKN